MINGTEFAHKISLQMFIIASILSLNFKNKIVFLHEQSVR